jgi:hypothetical protein
MESVTRPGTAMAQILKPPALLPPIKECPAVFLAGSIEMGQAKNWQRTLETALTAVDCLILNPRREVWDPDWVQSIENIQFREQVEWELAAQELADLIAMYFCPATKAPITLLELGLFARSGKVVVCCPDGFWRKGNVDIVCQRYGVPMVGDLAVLAEWVYHKLRR